MLHPTDNLGVNHYTLVIDINSQLDWVAQPDRPGVAGFNTHTPCQPTSLVPKKHIHCCLQTALGAQHGHAQQHSQPQFVTA